MQYASDSDNMTDSDSRPQEQPLKVRKKPGRKPNPASPALRKAQNRAAQRAFRERKEKHMRELEIAIKQVRDQRDKFQTENEQLKADQEIMRSENWYLKGIVLTLQLVCFQHNLVIPQHGPYINEQALSVLAQSIPESIATYINVNASNKLPIPSKLFGYRHTMKQRDRYLSSGSIVITKEGVHSIPERTPTNISQPEPPVSQRESTVTSDGMYDSDIPTDDFVHPLQKDENSSNMPPLSPATDDSDPNVNSTNEPSPPQPVMLTDEPITSNLAAIQTLRLRLRLQSACVRMDSIPFAIQPTILQLTIPHDPRIDLIPTPHMRDRMILYRDQFDLDDCFNCLLAHSVFHGGDPAIAANWQLPPEFFEKYWFLTIDYDLRRTTNRWRRLQGLNELDFKQQQKQQEQELKRAEVDQRQPILEHPQSLNWSEISSLLGIDFWKIAQQNSANMSSITDGPSYASSLSSDCSFNSTASPALSAASPATMVEDDPASSFEPVRLTDGYNLSYPKPQPPPKRSSHHKPRRHHPYYNESTDQNKSSTPSDAIDPWDTVITEPNKKYAMDTLADSERT